MIAGDGPLPASMKEEINVSMEQEGPEVDVLDKYRHLLANVYLHDCDLPELDVLLRTIIHNFPRMHYKGVMSLVHIFCVLVNESKKFEQTANASEMFKSETLKQVFGAGDELVKGHRPMEMFVTFVIRKNELLTHEAVIHLTDYLHAVILYNDIRVNRVQSICALLLAVDDFYFGMSDAAQGRLQMFFHSACVDCVSEDAFVAAVYESFATMERNKLLRRDNTDETCQKKIQNELTSLLLRLINSKNDADADDDDDDDDDDVDVNDDDDISEVVSSSVINDGESKPSATNAESEISVNDTESKPCANDAKSASCDNDTESVVNDHE